jgi:hypothetical protein
MNPTDIGIMNFRRRLVVAIRDTVLAYVNSPADISRMTVIPAAELGSIADLSEDQRQTIAVVVARALDEGLRHFLYGLDNQAGGFEIRYNGAQLNQEGLDRLADTELPSFAEESRFDADGVPKPE